MLASNYLATEAARRMMVDGLKQLRTLVNTAPFSQYVAEERAPGPGVTSDEHWLDFCRNTGETVYHPTSTCRMGTVAKLPCERAQRRTLPAHAAPCGEPPLQSVHPRVSFAPWKNDSFLGYPAGHASSPALATHRPPKGESGAGVPTPPPQAAPGFAPPQARARAFHASGGTRS